MDPAMLTGSFGGAGGAASVPASVPAAAQNMGPDIQQLVQNIDPKAIEAAFTPVAGSHAAQVPSAFTTPIAPHQDRPLDTRQVVGRKASTIQGIGNAITGATNAVGAFVNKQTQIKQGQIKDAAQKVILAQQGIDEAKQALQIAHDNNDTAGVQRATEMITQNTQARDAVFAGPQGKALVKGFDISYTDPESNKTTAHAGVQEGMKAAKTFAEKRKQMQEQQAAQAQARGSAIGAAFEKSMPQGMAANVPAQQKLAALQTQQKNQIEAARALIPYFTAQVKANNAMSIADKRNAMDLRIHVMDNLTEIDKQLLVNKQHEEDRAATKSLELLKLSIEHQNRLSEQESPTEVMKAFQTTAKNYQEVLDSTQKQRQALNNELDKKPGGGRQDEIRRQLTALDQNDTLATNTFNAGVSYAAKLTKIPVDQFKITVPAPQVGEGVKGADTGSSKSDSPDLDPRTGKPFKSSVPTTDRILVKALAGLSGIYSGASSAIQSADDTARKLERSLESDSSDGN